MRQLGVLAVAAMSLVSCATRQDVGDAHGASAGVLGLTWQASAGSNGRPVDRRVDLAFDIAGRPFPSPLLHAWIGEHATFLLVDTGTSYHALSGWLASALSLQVAEAGPGKDHVGRDIRISVIERATIAAGDWGMLVEQPLLVAEVPQPFQELNVGGFLSPQFLAQDKDDRVLLDLERAELRVVSRTAAVEVLAHRGGRMNVAGSRVCNATHEVPYRMFVVPAVIEGEPVHLLVDTGAERTNIRASSRLGAKLMSRVNGDSLRVYGAAGAFTADLFDGARVQIGDVVRTTDLEIVPGPANTDCPSDGVLGMDILRSCILALGEAAFDGRCAPEGDGGFVKGR